MVITFFGHSDYLSSEEDEKAIMDILYNTVEGKECEFLLGGYGTFDGFAKRCCLKYKEVNPNVKLTLVLPYLDREYFLDGYDDSVYPPVESVPKRFAIAARNAWMVEKADIVIAYVFHCGGAKTALEIAKRKNKIIYNVADIC